LKVVTGSGFGLRGGIRSRAAAAANGKASRTPSVDDATAACIELKYPKTDRQKTLARPSAISCAGAMRGEKQRA
jgi:hypothetical protein